MKFAQEFWAAAIQANGKLVGKRTYNTAVVESRFGDPLRTLVESKQTSFNGSICLDYPYIHLQMTNLRGQAAITTFHANGEIASSGLLVRGNNTVIDNQMTSMYCKSLLQCPLIRNSNSRNNPANVVESIKERPLVISTLWGNPKISDLDYGYIIQCELNLAAIFLFAR